MAMTTLERRGSAGAGGETPPAAAGWRPTGAQALVLVGAAAAALSAAAAGLSPWLLLAAAAGAATAFAFLVAGRIRANPGSDAERRPLAQASAADILDTMPEPVIVVDARDTVMIANRAAAAMLPLLKAGMPLYRALRYPDILDGIGSARSRREAVTVHHLETAPVERRFDVEVVPLAPGGPGGGDPPVALWFHDRTTARRLDTMRTDFVAHASHELRTPLATILGFIDTLQGPARDDKPARERFLGIMRDQARRMARLIDDLLSLSRIEMNEHVRPKSRVALEPLIGHVLDTLAPLAREQQVAIAYRPPAGEHWIRGERDEVLRVFENLVENALKYGASGGRIEIAIEELPPPAAGGPPQVAVAVRDHGPGIAPEHLPRLTERFYRVDVAEPRQGRTGLGLAIVKHIMSRHGGRMEIQSERGKGATFRVIFPQVPAN